MIALTFQSSTHSHSSLWHQPYLINIYLYEDITLPAPAISGVIHNISSTLAASDTKGVLNNRSVSPIKTDSSAERTAQNSELVKGHGLLADLKASLTTLTTWLTKLLGLDTPKKQTLEPIKSTESKLDTSAISLKTMTLEAGNSGLIRAALQQSIASADLSSDYKQLATGNGTLRSLATALVGIRGGTSIDATAKLTSALLNQEVGGHPLQQWGTVGGKVESWLATATPDQLTKAATQLTKALTISQELTKAVKLELEGQTQEAGELTSKLLSELNSNGLSASQSATKIDWSDFKPDSSAPDMFAALKKITHEQLGDRFITPREQSDNRAEQKKALPFELRHIDIPMLKETLSVPTKNGGSTPFNAHTILNGNAIASQAPMKGQNTLDFADLLVSSKATYIINLQNEGDKNKNGFVDYSSLGEHKFSSKIPGSTDFVQFKSEEYGDSVKKLTVTGTSGETKELYVINVPVQDHGTIDPTTLHEAVLLAEQYQNALGGVPLIHCNAGVGRTGLFAEASRIYSEFKNGKLDENNYAAQIAEWTLELRGERSAAMVQTKEQFLTLVEYAEALLFDGLASSNTNTDENIYENTNFQHEEPAEYVNTQQLAAQRNQPSSAPIYENVRPAGERPEVKPKPAIRA